MTVPVVYSLARCYPDVRITMLRRAYARPLFEHMPHNVSFMEADIKREYRGVRGLNALYRRLTAKNFTAIADLHCILRSDYLRMRFNIDRYKAAHIDKHRAGRRMLTASSNKRLVQLPTLFRDYADVFERIGYPVTLDFKSVFPPEGGDLGLLPPPFNKPKEGTQKWIGIAPFAEHEGKTYPPRLMEKVFCMLKDHHPDCRIYFFGGKEKDGDVVKEWCGKYEWCTDASKLPGGTGDELILMSHLDLMITMDNACMHTASIVGTPVVSVWGATHPYAGRTGWGQSPGNAVQIDLPCRPCSITGSKHCLRGDCFCMKNIPPEQIIERAEIAIRGNRHIIQ